MSIFGKRKKPETDKLLEDQEAASQQTLAYVARVLQRKDSLLAAYQLAEAQRTAEARRKGYP